MDEEHLNKIGGERIFSRQVDELIGLCRGIVADGEVNKSEAEFLQKWLAASAPVSQHAVLYKLYDRVHEMLADGHLDASERQDLLETLQSVADHNFELGETMKPTTLPLCKPAPTLKFPDVRYCFTGTFAHGSRDHLHAEVADRGGIPGSLTQKTQVLVIGSYATESWKHSSFGRKIEQASDWRRKGVPISIVTEAHWVQYLS